MQYKTYSFSELIRDYEIVIPMIQRDYAQGRTDEKTKNIRNTLLENINNETEIKLDFIYGYIEKRDEHKIFIPLDGQQRLTTLFLLHWYVAATHNDKNENLKKFRYETRTSSTDFMQALVNNIGNLKIPPLLPIEEDGKNKKSPTELSKIIKNGAWFFNSWENDPTIAAMLVMLDAIHGCAITRDKLNKITFDFINMGDFKLSDDLYLKMNARGVQLTSFENFKAFFEKHLEKIDDNLKKCFSKNIDNKWLDIFWKLEYTEQDATDKSYYTIDKPFMHFFWYITEMLYFKQNISKNAIFSYDEYGNPQIDYEVISLVYQERSAIDFLFQCLNNIKILNDRIEETCCYEYNSEAPCTLKVPLFKNKSNEFYNFLTRSVKKGKLSHYEKLILFTIIHHVNTISFDIKKHTANLYDIIRVVRNLLLSVRNEKK